ncbi:lipoprotein receptor-related protein [Candidatus Vecturithrix granuli]|uniref:Lipoprotein receptor-related protein n=1 Tax=Vecturithrix granuli TaxID=1499967 RepID=A0A081BYK9_VECG1|nr:lipoprotein receptor-related protein [Candidatus Vecturithrix granuli]
MKKNNIYQSLSFGAVSLAFILLLSAAAVQAETISVAAFTDGAPSCNNLNQADNNLRSAICYVNTKAGDTMTNPFTGATFTGHIIELPAGTYNLTRPGSGEDANSSGDLDISAAGKTVMIIGQGAGAIIDAGDIDRIFNILSGTVILNNLTIRNGTANWGGGIQNLSALTITNCTITGNTATDKGGGLHNSLGTMTINNSIIESNMTSGSMTYGGGISIYDGVVTLSNSTVRNNTAQNSGGGIYMYNTAAQLNVTQSTISGNFANGSGTNNGLGGGIFQTVGTTILTNSTVSGNTSRLGGGIFLQAGTLNLRHATVASNTATLDAGGLRVYDPYGPTATSTNSIIASNIDNTANDYPDIQGTLTSSGYNLISQSYSTGNGTDKVGVLAYLEALASNGGSTYTHALQSMAVARPIQPISAEPPVRKTRVATLVRLKLRLWPRPRRLPRQIPTPRPRRHPLCHQS